MTHPIIVVAATSFAQEFGTQAAKAIFQRFNENGERTAAELKRIHEELRRINQRLDALISAVGHLPAIIVGKVAELNVDAAYDQLKAQRLSFMTNPTEPVDNSDMQLAVAQWLTIVRLEDRPSYLMMLPDHTQYVRGIVASLKKNGSIDGTLRDHLVEKKSKIDQAIQSLVQRLRTLEQELERIWAAHFAWDTPIFKHRRFLGSAPFVDYAFISNPRPNVSGRLGRVINNQAVFDQKVAEVKNILQKPLSDYVETARRVQALVPVQQLIELYLPELNQGGTLKAMEDHPEG
jgi:hypothetical protein